jgi:hypothetical protein
MKDLASLLKQAGKAINTEYLPKTFTTHEEFVYECMKIQMGRSFSSSGFSEASFELFLGNHQTTLCYISTSGTGIFVTLKRDTENDVEQIIMEINLPRDRSKPGRNTYEVITREFSRYSFRKDHPTMPVPNWLVNQEYWDGRDPVKELEKMDFVKVETPLGSYWEGHGVQVTVTKDGGYTLEVFSKKDGKGVALYQTMFKVKDIIQLLIEHEKKVEKRKNQYEDEFEGYFEDEDY